MNEEVQQCINTVTDDRRSLFKKPQSLIMRINPTVDVRLSYKIPTYKEKTGWVALGY